MLWEIAIHAGWGLTGGKHKLNLDPVYDHPSTLLVHHIGGPDIADLAASVSYTHLTLPTIYSV